MCLCVSVCGQATEHIFWPRNLIFQLRDNIYIYLGWEDFITLENKDYGDYWDFQACAQSSPLQLDVVFVMCVFFSNVLFQILILKLTFDGFFWTNCYGIPAWSFSRTAAGVKVVAAVREFHHTCGNTGDLVFLAGHYSQRDGLVNELLEILMDGVEEDRGSCQVSHWIELRSVCWLMEHFLCLFSTWNQDEKCDYTYPDITLYMNKETDKERNL